ncbi:MAG: hypothetical protein NC931_04060 [Candidatus Omnitrophica bacterium]|nr:hypothetical protein [Candidatus Omnitrophota bacterium]MCM8821779.1 hypothetical protein [Candidatus Omnitrophota bacterium]MCM8828608.1 hypothetical protein [Candidatus Omnitrophota bacterium]
MKKRRTKSVESFNVYAVRFEKEQGPVYAVWAGPQRQCRISFPVKSKTRPYLVDSQCNEVPVQIENSRANFKAGASPVWLIGAGEINYFSLEETSFNSLPGKEAKVLVDGEKIGQWLVDSQPYPEMEAMNKNRPVRILPGFQV